MKLSCLVITGVLLSTATVIANPLSAQRINEVKVTIGLNNESLIAAFKKIERQTDFRFAFVETQVSRYNQINMPARLRSVEQTMHLLLKGTGLVYLVKKNNIVVVPGKEKTEEQKNAISVSLEKRELMPAISSEIPGILLKGKVFNENGEPIAGASVTIKATGRGTATDNYGLFQLNGVPADAVLLISTLGYETAEIKVEGRNFITVKVKAKEASKLDDVVVVGYGTTTKRLNTGSVGTVTATEIAKQTIDNPLNALQGKVAGMLVTQTNGLPGSGTTIQIRGQGTMGYTGSIPLYVIDGVPYTNFNGSIPANDNLNAYGISAANGGVSPFYNINPADIEQIDVLKDADATAIYGARGANGVILITTKKGKSGGTRLDVNVYSGSGKVGRYVPMLNLKQYLQLRREAFANDGITATTANAPDLLVWDTTQNTDWQKYLIGGAANTTNATATLSGGEGATHFLFTSSYLHTGTVYPGSFSSNRFSNRLNVEHTSRDQRLYASFSASYSYDKTTLPTSDILTSLFYLPPDYPLHTASGGIYWDPAGTYTNPLASLLRTTVGQTTNLITNGSLHYRIWKGLTAKANLGYTASGLYQNGQRPKTSYNPTSTTLANAYFADNKVQNYVVEPQLEYSTVIGKGKLQVLAGGTIQQTTAKGYEIYGSGYTNDALLNNFLGAGTLTPYYNNSTTYKYNALFGRINYNLAEKYLLNINFRRDGSSRFGSNHHYGNFGSAGAAWIFTQESFVKGAIPFLSYEKLRASYGITGNDQITNYQYLSTYGSSSTYAYQSTAVYYPSGVPNPDLQWETNKKLEVAVELGFLKDRILLTTAYYRNRSGNLLIYLALPSQVGFSTYLGNFPAVVQNSGLEVELNTKNIKSKDFEWTTSFNFSLPKNQVTSFPGLATSSYANTYVIGQPVNLIKVYSYTGTKSTDGTLSVSSDYNNRLVTSVGTPYNGGMNNNITYKSLQLSFFFQYNHQMGRTMYQYGPTPIGGMYNQYTAVLNRWQKAGDNALFPKATTSSSTSVGANTYYFLNSNAFWGDASFIKLKTVSLSYSLPAALIKKIKMSTCSFYIQGQNLFTWSKQKYVLDPETSLPGTGGGLGTGVMNVPPLRTIVAGIRCSL